MRILSKSDCLEARAATVYTLLQMDRVDLAVLVTFFARACVSSSICLCIQKGAEEDERD